jgi:hypothetical protein
VVRQGPRHLAGPSEPPTSKEEDNWSFDFTNEGCCAGVFHMAVAAFLPAHLVDHLGKLFTVEWTVW